MLFASPELQVDDLRVLELIGKIYKSMRFALGAPRRWEGILARSMLAKAIRGSNSIEGYLVSQEDAMAAVDGEEPLDAEKTTWLEIVGYRNAMTFVLQLAAKDSHFVFNEGFLRSLHFMMLQQDLNKNPGTWRPGAIFVRDKVKQATVYEGPAADNVPKLMDEFIRYLQGKEDDHHILVKAAMAHLNLVMIHPFSDGNGRMARCIQTLVIAVRGVVAPAFCSIEEYLGRNRQEYYDVLAQVGRGGWHPESNTQPWLRFIIKAHYQQAATAIARMRVMKKLWDALEELIARSNLPERSIFALADAAVGYHVRGVHYRNNAEVSSVVASRDLKLLVDRGMLIPEGEKRGRVYTAAEQIRSVYVKARSEELSQIPDPYVPGVQLPSTELN